MLHTRQYLGSVLSIVLIGQQKGDYLGGIGDATSL